MGTVKPRHRLSIPVRFIGHRVFGDACVIEEESKGIKTEEQKQRDKTKSSGENTGGSYHEPQKK